MEIRTAEKIKTGKYIPACKYVVPKWDSLFKNKLCLTGKPHMFRASFKGARACYTSRSVLTLPKKKTKKQREREYLKKKNTLNFLQLGPLGNALVCAIWMAVAVNIPSARFLSRTPVIRKANWNFRENKNYLYFKAEFLAYRKIAI